MCAAGRDWLWKPTGVCVFEARQEFLLGLIVFYPL